MARSEQRQAALRLCLATFGGIAALFAWVAILTFSPADPPSSSVWPANESTENWCGTFGARLAYYLFYFLGVGTYPFAALLTFALISRARGMPLTDAWLRAFGLGLITVAVSAAAAMFLPPSPQFLHTGPGGLVGGAAAAWLTQNLQIAGTLFLLILGVVVGLLLAADELFFGVSRGIEQVGRQSMPYLRQGGTLIAQAGAAAGAAVAARVSNATAMLPKLATSPAGGESGDSTARRGRGASERGARDVPEAAAMTLPSVRPTRAPAPAEPAEEDEPVEVDATGGPSGRFISEELFDDETPEAEDSETESDPADGESECGADEPRPGAAPVVRDVSHKAQLPAKTVDPRPTRGNYVLPSLSLLEDPDPIDKSAIESLCREKAYILEQTLTEFKLQVQVVAIETGPVITVFELRLAPGIKVSQIVSLSNDIARALKAPSVRVVAPLPGKNTIGIEVPNIDKEKVRFKELIRMVGAKLDQYALPLFLGKDASGAPLVTDLAKMPHGLVAGTTGSGKSICIASIVMSILYTRTPDEVNLILVDPKVVELAMFRDIPHLMCPIVTDMAKAADILDWAATKMDERYALLAEAGVKDIRSYNRLGEAGLRERMQITDDEEFKHIPVRLPYIVIVIDELADLMMTAAKETEFYLCRLAQKSRAVGIHLIVSTQRPQANVVTGLIKSNLPSRICFRVSSRLDSRIVLDQNGGEVLMGQGDMLFLPPGSSKLVRSQGTFISDEELRATVKYCKTQAEPQYHPELTRSPKAEGEGAGERDELFDAAVDIIVESGRGSVSLLQRKLTIGYSRASRLIEQMYVAGLVGEYKGSQAREVLVTKEEWQALRTQRDREEAGT